MPNLRHTNEVIGAYVCTVERLKLTLKERVIYCDTDSMIYIRGICEE
jgi:hypothetical protein